MKSRLTKLLVAMCVGVAALVLANPAGAVASADQIAAGPYHMAFRHSEKCVAIPNNTTTNVQLHQWSCFDTASELWYSTTYSPTPTGSTSTEFAVRTAESV